MRVICPNCHTEFDIQNGNGSGHICNCDINDTTVIGTLVPAINTNNAKGENKMAENNTNNGISMETLMTMVLNQQTQMANLVKALTTPTATAQSEPVTETPVTVNGGKFGKTSQFYGKELCGYMWNPYMVARFLPKKFREWMSESYDNNIYGQIRSRVTLMEAIHFCIDECKRLDLMEREDKIAFNERKYFWSVGDMRNTFLHYYNCIKTEIAKAKMDLISMSNKGKGIRYVKFHGRKYKAKIYFDTDNDSYRPSAEKKVSIEWDIEDNIESVIRDLNNAKTYGELYMVMKLREKGLLKLKPAYIQKYDRINKKVTSVSDISHSHNSLPKSFVDGYLKKGAYYTIKDDLMFNDKSLNTYSGWCDRSSDTPSVTLKGHEAIAYIMDRLASGQWRGYNFFALYKSMNA